MKKAIRFRAALREALDVTVGAVVDDTTQLRKVATTTSKVRSKLASEDGGLGSQGHMVERGDITHFINVVSF